MECKRQGDILIERISEAEFLKGKKYLGKTENKALAEGEATGHLHLLTGEVDIYGYSDDKMFEVKNTATLIHPEHKPLTFDKGFYRVRRQREYDPIQHQRRISD